MYVSHSNEPILDYHSVAMDLQLLSFSVITCSMYVTRCDLESLFTNVEPGRVSNKRYIC